MASVNKFIGIGHLGRDPEMRYMQSGEAVSNISIACTESYKDKTSGEKKEITEWVRIVFFGKLAEIAGQYLKKGSQVYVEGRLQTRKWTDSAGAEKYTTEIVADKLQMLGGRPTEGETQERAAPREQANRAQPKLPAANGLDEDIPF